LSQNLRRPHDHKARPIRNFAAASLVSFIFVVLNTMVDITYAFVDPRLRDNAVRGGAGGR
jgi:hypothetical protein